MAAETRRLRPLETTKLALVWQWGIFCGIASSEMTDNLFLLFFGVKSYFGNCYPLLAVPHGK